METSENSISPHTSQISETPETSTSSLAASPASLFPLPDAEQAPKTTVISGQRCSALYAISNPDGLSLKMCADYLVKKGEWYSSKCALTWKEKRTKFKRLLFQLQASALLTEETGYGLLPTAVANDDNKSPAAHMAMKARMKGGPRYKPTSLQVVIKMLPTPRMEGFDAGKHRGKPDSVHSAIKMLATPQARDYRGYARVNSHSPYKMLNEEVGNSLGLKLQPAFVEWMMGYPEGWTELPDSKLLEMQSSRRSQKK